MIPPTRNHLEALAGWAIASRGNCSDQQHLALCHFQEGCVELSEVIDDLVVAQPSSSIPKVQVIKSATVDRPVPIPEEVQVVLGVQQDGPCRHHFDIRTQVCHYCGLTYLKAMGRKPELM